MAANPTRAIGQASPSRSRFHAESVAVSADLDFGTVAAGATATDTASLTGAQAGESVLATAPSGLHADLLTHSAYVATAHVVTVKVRNVGAGAVSDGARTWMLRVLRGGK